MLLEKFDTSNNVVNSLTKSIGTKKLSWHRESMNIVAMNMWPYKSRAPLFCKENKKWEDVKDVLYPFNVDCVFMYKVLIIECG